MGWEDDERMKQVSLFFGTGSDYSVRPTAAALHLKEALCYRLLFIRMLISRQTIADNYYIFNKH